MESSSKAKFLWDLGIRKDNYPKSFLEKVEDITKTLSNTEIGYCAVKNRCDGKVEKFCMRDVVGTDHSRYAGRTWIEAFLDLDRGDNIIGLYHNNPQYWEEEMKDIETSDVGLLKQGNKYYIFSKAGGGNNRLITMKIRYLALLEQAGDNQEEIDKINEQFTFTANVREFPRDNTIPHIIVAMGEDLGYSVKKEGEQYTVIKRIEGIETETFKGNEEELENYFRSLFDASVYGEEEVNRRLTCLDRGASFSGPKYKEIIESVLPIYKQHNIPDGYDDRDEK